MLRKDFNIKKRHEGYIDINHVAEVGRNILD